MKLKRYKKRKISLYFSSSIIIIIISLIFALIIINYFSRRANLILYPMAESMTRKVVTRIINDAIDEDSIGDNLYVINKDSNDEIKMITYNSFEVTKLINDVTSNIERMIRDIEEGKVNYYGDNSDNESGVISEIPFGVIFGNSLLSGIGPKLKLRLKMLGDVTSNIETEVKPYGINNAYVEMRIKLEVTARIVLPFVSEKVVISNVIPLSMNIVQGNIPEGFVYSYK
ncbi:MAG: sporulation protein YunB [Bacilli bacterium]|nr:sporulation protein YunB [Bacilli bacterium]